MREVCCAENMSPDPEKISARQVMTGSQYLTNDGHFDTPQSKQVGRPTSKEFIQQAQPGISPVRQI